MLKINLQIFFVILLLTIIGFCSASIKVENQKSQLPSYTENKWRRSYNNEQLNDTFTPDSSKYKERLQRFGYTTGYGGLNGYPHSGTGLSGYSPVKIDLGGVVLGTLVGIGAILIIPKLINVFHGGYGGGQYARSDSSNDESTITSMLTKLDTALDQNNIDSTSCMQRAVCSYIRSTETNIVSGSADQIDNIVHALSDNSLVEYMLDGTALKDALANGKKINEIDCEKLYTTCPLNVDKATKILRKILVNE